MVEEGDLRSLAVSEAKRRGHNEYSHLDLAAHIGHTRSIHVLDRAETGIPEADSSGQRRLRSPRLRMHDDMEVCGTEKSPDQLIRYRRRRSIDKQRLVPDAPRSSPQAFTDGWSLPILLYRTEAEALYSQPLHRVARLVSTKTRFPGPLF